MYTDIELDPSHSHDHVSVDRQPVDTSNPGEVFHHVQIVWLFLRHADFRVESEVKPTVLCGIVLDIRQTSHSLPSLSAEGLVGQQTVVSG